MNNKYIYIRGNEDNLEDILRLLDELLQLHNEIDAEFNLSPNYLSIYRKSLMIELKNPDAYYCQMVYHDNKPIGFGVAKKIYSPAMFRDPYKGYIPHLYIRPSFRRQGIGRKILSKLEQWFRENKLNIIEVEVIAENKKALDFYIQSEFKTTSKRLRKQMGD